MKSSPEYPIRRVAVFGGYNHPDPAPAWPRVVRPRALRPVEADDRDEVFQLELGLSPVDLQRAA